MTTIKRPDSRTMPFSRGGEQAAGTLLPNGPDPLYDVPPTAPDLDAYPWWVRRDYDAWTTEAFRALVLAWLADLMQANKGWIAKFTVRERATFGRSTERLLSPWLIVIIQRSDNGKFIECSSAWTAAERDDAARVTRKLADMRRTIEQLGALP